MNTETKSQTLKELKEQMVRDAQWRVEYHLRELEKARIELDALTR